MKYRATYAYVQSRKQSSQLGFNLKIATMSVELLNTLIFAFSIAQPKYSPLQRQV